jgi:HEAT repeat protein
LKRSSKDRAREFDRVVTHVVASAHAAEIRRDLRRGLRLLSKAGVHSFEALTTAHPCLRGVAGWTAIRLLEERGRRSASALVRLLTLGDELLAIAASKALANIGGTQARRGCVRIVDSDAPRWARCAATYALAHMRDDDAAKTLAKLVRDRDEDPTIRGQAAEGLDYIGREDGPHRRLAARTALRALDDPSPIVRFWCAFALGAMPYPPAIPALRRLRRDNAVCPGWWRVGDEAAAAVAHMEGRPTPERARPAS